jgi:ribosomal protein S18 acetylase RimI-like enzyme
MGVTNLDGYPFPVESPYSGKNLPVLINREAIRLPARLKLLHDLRSEDAEEFIDFIHLRKEFVPQLNRLLKAHFWPGIDVSESLDWPDFTIVLLYKKLVIGTAICNPEGYISYLLVHPDWQGAGLASKMLFFMATRLVPPGKDLSVHVAVGNGPAMCLYQRFGFKPEEFIVDFYSKRYSRAGGDENALPDPALRNAFYLRLRR